MRLSTLYSILLVVLGAVSCRPSDPPPGPEVPRGYLATLRVDRGGRRLTFGPFVGYYFRPESPPDLETLHFICFNERSFYTTNVPANTRLYEGTAILAQLPDVGRSLPAGRRINPVFFADAPQAWTQSRPEPQEEYRHFHSCYTRAGPSRSGYWLRHVAHTNFVYDMGGRVGRGSPLYHAVQPGVDTGFARIIEFDRGPSRSD